MSVHTQLVALSLNGMRKNRNKRAELAKKIKELDTEYESLYKLIRAHEEFSGETFLDPKDPDFVPPVLIPCSSFVEIKGTKISRSCVSVEDLIVQFLFQKKTVPSSIDDIYEAMVQNGFKYSYGHINSRTYHLHGKNRIRRVSRGRYVHPDFIQEAIKNFGSDDSEVSETETQIQAKS